MYQFIFLDFPLTNAGYQPILYKSDYSQDPLKFTRIDSTTLTASLSISIKSITFEQFIYELHLTSFTILPYAISQSIHRVLVFLNKYICSDLYMKIIVDALLLAICA